MHVLLELRCNISFITCSPRRNIPCCQLVANIYSYPPWSGGALEMELSGATSRRRADQSSRAAHNRCIISQLSGRASIRPHVEQYSFVHFVDTPVIMFHSSLRGICLYIKRLRFRLNHWTYLSPIHVLVHIHYFYKSIFV